MNLFYETYRDMTSESCENIFSGIIRRTQVFSICRRFRLLSFSRILRISRVILKGIGHLGNMDSRPFYLSIYQSFALKTFNFSIKGGCFGHHKLRFGQDTLFCCSKLSKTFQKCRKPELLECENFHGELWVLSM